MEEMEEDGLSLGEGEGGRKFEGDGIVNPFGLASRLRWKSKSSVKSCVWYRLSCGRPNTREGDIEANNAVAVNTEDLILKADEKLNVLCKKK